MFSDAEKLEEISRELEMRHRVYKWQVRNGKLSAEIARRRIDLMIEIKLDYADKLKTAKRESELDFG